MVGSYFTHNPSIVISMRKLLDLIVMGGLQQASLANTIFLSIPEAKAH